jgi:hypothetical protein
MPNRRPATGGDAWQRLLGASEELEDQARAEREPELRKIVACEKAPDHVRREAAIRLAHDRAQRVAKAPLRAAHAARRARGALARRAARPRPDARPRPAARRDRPRGAGRRRVARATRAGPSDDDPAADPPPRPAARLTFACLAPDERGGPR